MTKPLVSLGWLCELILLKVVHFHERNSNSVIYTTHDRSVVTWLQRRDDRTLAWLSRSMPAVLNRADLISGDNAADRCSLPVIV